MKEYYNLSNITGLISDKEYNKNKDFVEPKDYGRTEDYCRTKDYRWTEKYGRIEVLRQNKDYGRIIYYGRMLGQKNSLGRKILMIEKNRGLGGTYGDSGVGSEYD